MLCYDVSCAPPYILVLHTLKEEVSMHLNSTFYVLNADFSTP